MATSMHNMVSWPIKTEQAQEGEGLPRGQAFWRRLGCGRESSPHFLRLLARFSRDGGLLSVRIDSCVGRDMS